MTKSSRKPALRPPGTLLYSKFCFLLCCGKETSFRPIFWCKNLKSLAGAFKIQQRFHMLLMAKCRWTVQEQEVWLPQWGHSFWWFLVASFQCRCNANITRNCTMSVATPRSGRSYIWETFTSGKYSGWLKMFCTLQTPQASVSMLNVKIHDKISKMPQI